MMSTKEQERKALEKIRKIVEELGEDSYIGIAFEGCFEDAEENIENDFGMSMKDRWLTVESEKEKLEAKVAEKDDQIKRLQAANQNMLIELNEKEKALNTKDYRIAELDASRKECAAQSVEHWNKLREAETKLEEKENEIIRLKAKLFDMMMAAK